MKKQITVPGISIAIVAVMVLALEHPISAAAEKSSQASSQTKSKQKPKPKKPSINVVNNAHCPVAGSAIGSMGEGTSVDYKGYKVSLCCAGCTAKFNANPDAYLNAALADSKRQ